MADETTIANMALSHIGHGYAITDLETEDSEAAEACRTFYTQVVAETFREFAWPFATKTAFLGLVQEFNLDDDDEDDDNEWGFSYRYPADCKFFRRILSGLRNDTQGTATPYRIGKDDDGQLIFTDYEDAKGEYTVEVETGFWPADFTQAVAFKLAYYIAPRLTKGDPFGIQQRVGQAYFMAISKAMAQAAQEEQKELPPDGDFVTSRDA